MEMIKSEETKEQELKKSQHSLSDLWNTTKQTNTCIVGIPEGEQRNEERLFDEIAENIPI